MEIVTLEPGKLIAIDPGHGGKDPGAVVEGTSEATINLHVALMLQAVLRMRGYGTIMTRTTHEATISLSERAQIANDAKADAFISIHCNAFTEHSVHGFEVFYHPSKDHALASEIALAKEAAFPGRKFRRGAIYPAKKANYAVLRMTEMPSALVELGFLTNPKDRDWLQDLNNQLRSAQAIRDGILAWDHMPPVDHGSKR